MKCMDEPRVNRVTKSNCVGALMQDEYRRVTKTLAKSMFLLKDVDLGSLTRQYASPNPHYRSGPSMLLYSIRAVMLSAQEKYGSFEKLETEKERLENKRQLERGSERKMPE